MITLAHLCASRPIRRQLALGCNHSPNISGHNRVQGNATRRQRKLGRACAASLSQAKRHIPWSAHRVLPRRGIQH